MRKASCRTASRLSSSSAGRSRTPLTFRPLYGKQRTFSIYKQFNNLNKMSQNYFDKYVNRIGEEAQLFATVINRNQITREEIANWVED